ncbi:MAG: Double zinc ribbon, partial [Acidobacteriota bacterium]|nr:Double zinc ribbon [Acidobacteriota bacterium]
MFCPQCGANQSDDLKFCNLCGANLQAVRHAVATRETGEKFDWSKTWMAE